MMSDDSRRFCRVLAALAPDGPTRASDVQAPGLDDRAVALGLGPAMYAAAQRALAHDDRAAARFPRSRAAYFRAAGRTSHQLAQAESIAVALRSAGVPAIALKGIALARRYYADPAARPMTDIDLLVRGADLAGAEAMLRRAGFTDAVDATFAATLRRRHHHLPPLRDPAGGELIELHHDLLPRASRVRIDVDALWRRSITEPDSALRFLAPEDLYLHLAIHLLHSSAVIGRIGALLDLHVLATTEMQRAPDFGARLSVRAISLGLSHWAGLAAALSHDVFQTDLAGDRPRNSIGVRVSPRQVRRFRDALLSPLERPLDRAQHDRWMRRKLWLERPTVLHGLRLAAGALMDAVRRPRPPSIRPASYTSG